ncbi:MAG: tetratricopeptide repeat protein [Bacteroidia bacterium]
MRKTLFLLLFLLVADLFGQQSLLPIDSDKDLRRGAELFDKQQFSAAQEAFRLAAQGQDLHSERRKIAEYYLALCAIELFNRDAEVLLTQFIYRHPESPLVKQAWFQLGKFFFREKKYTKAEEWFDKVEPAVLSEAEQEEFYFKRGYSGFRTEKYATALADFAKIKEGEGPYASTAKYYYAHIQYQDKNYEAALQDFLKLSNDEIFSSIVPFYISQIYYLQGKYDQVINYAQPLLDTVSTGSREAEIARLIGDSYYNTGKYKEAIPYLEKFRDKAPGQRTRSDDYQLGFAYFKENMLPQAILAFQFAVGNEDALGQSAWYHLGWCQLQVGDKKFARNAWREAAKTDFDTLLKEQALFDYAKLAYELGYDPYDEAVLALQDYINKYPNSDRLDEAYSFLSSIYLTTKNYRTALMSLDRIKQLTEPLKEAYQRVAYLRGIELVNDKNYGEAIRHFDLSLKYPLNKELAADARYWKAEALYRGADFTLAAKSWEEFVYTLSAFELKKYNKVNYNLGYAYYKLRDYDKALTWFRKYNSVNGDVDARLLNDAQARIADCFFYKKNYAAATEYYDKAIQSGLNWVDYSMFQKALTLYMQGKFDDELKTLNKLIKDIPGSKYADDAKYEAARIYMLQERYDEAYAMYSGILLNHSESPLAASSKVQMGLVRYNQRRDDEALKIYNEVIDQYPGSEEAKEAQLGIKKIYVEKGDVSAYQELASEKGLQTMGRTEFDSTSWEAAEASYLRQDCEKAVQLLGEYLKEFPQGLFSTQALGYQADCLMRSRQVEKAAKNYRELLQRPRNKFTAEAHNVLGIFERESNHFTEAMDHFMQLEKIAETPEQEKDARRNIMQLAVKTGEVQIAAKYANEVLQKDKDNQQLVNEAHLILGRTSLVAGDNSEALKHFQKIRKVNSEAGAEARYSIALVHFRNGDYKKCEKEIFSLVDDMPSYDHWLARGFILLADNYVKLDNVFQAKRTLQSVIENHEGEELRELARQKLADIEASEVKPEATPEQEQQIDLNKQPGNDRLFENTNQDE